MTALTLGAAINAGLERVLEDDDKVLLMGEDIGKLGGVFRVTDGLQQRFGAQRVIDTPLAEAGIVGTAVGLALRGYRPVAFRNLNAVLDAAGCGFDDVVDVTIFIVDPETRFERIWSVAQEFWGGPPHPTVTAVGVTWLYGFQFEIKVVARLPEETQGANQD